MKKLAMALGGAAVLAVAAVELVIRLLIAPSPSSYGTFRGLELPPLKVVPFAHFERPERDAPIPGLRADGAPLTYGDLYGCPKDDPEIGVVWEENRRSRNGWWESNDVGARAGAPTPKAAPEGKTRIAVFGDSFAAGTRLREADTWTARLASLRPGLDVVNFGVDGYGLAQTLLLDRRVRARIDYDVALYVFVPYHQPWRDANVVRFLGERWNSFAPMPRFVLDGDGIRLVPPLYPDPSTVFRRDYPAPSPELRAHLRAYDRFYVPALYEPPAVLSRLAAWKIYVARREQQTQKLTRRTIGTDVDGEGFELSRRILKTARAEAAASGRRLVVVVLPVERDLENLAKLQKARDRWTSIVEGLRGLGLETIDLAPALAAAAKDGIDNAADGSHYGPKMSAAIAQALADALR